MYFYTRLCVPYCTLSIIGWFPRRNTLTSVASISLICGQKMPKKKVPYTLFLRKAHMTVNQNLFVPLPGVQLSRHPSPQSHAWM